MPQTSRKIARDYRHKEQTLLRPEGGAQEVFPPSRKKPPKTWSYDSSLSPELSWDESQARAEGERLLQAIVESKNLEQAKQEAEKLKALSKHFLNWSGKAERGSFTVPTLPLFIHERLSTQAVLETLKRRLPKRNERLTLFGEGDMSIGEKIRGAYEHLNGWQNRLILGDSLQVMNSLLEYESLGGQVQTIYMDPPYGVKFGSNFQPFVRKHKLKDGADEAITREPEMVRAYRDTWELGVHSWLTYMRDRLLLARELLADSGSCFVQISEDNLHHVREIMDEIFGAENFISLINFATTSGFSSSAISRVGDYLCWYAKDRIRMKYRQLFQPKKATQLGDDAYRHIKLPDGTRRAMTKEEREGNKPLPKGSSIFQYGDIQSQGAASKDTPFEFEGETFRPLTHSHWKANWPDGMENLRKAKRLAKVGNKIRYIRYLDDFLVQEITNAWMDTGFAGFASNKQYVVETNKKVVQRCLLMTTDPGDLVLDPTCGSGTTALMAEQWGRRWITIDVSRVPLALVRQRLLTATYPYYQLKDERRGPSGGFVYARRKNQEGREVGGLIPRITLKSIANQEPPQEEVLVDNPEIQQDAVRITGPFCVEAILPTPLSPETDSPHIQEDKKSAPEDENDHIGRMIDVLRLSPAINLPGAQVFNLTKIRPAAKSINLHAEAEQADTNAPVAIVFGPSNGAVSERAVIEAGKESRAKDYKLLLVIGFAIEPASRETVEQGEATLGIRTLYAQATTDLVMSDLLKSTRSSQLFAVVGLPDVKLEKIKEKAEDGSDLWKITLRGLDVFDPVTMKHQALAGNDVPCWMLDTDYDGQCFRASQVFFPRTSAWENIGKEVKADFDESVWRCLGENVSAPFAAGDQVAVKVLDDRGNELMVVKRIADVA